MRAHHSGLSRCTGTGRSLRTCRTASAPCNHDTNPACIMQQLRQHVAEADAVIGTPKKYGYVLLRAKFLRVFASAATASLCRLAE